MTLDEIRAHLQALQARDLPSHGGRTLAYVYDSGLAEWKGHMDKYYSDRLYPNMPDWQVMCFYPMSKRRNVGANWYAQDFAARRELMSGHAKTGRKFSGKIRQLITGSTGLDSHEWGVTLFAHDI